MRLRIATLLPLGLVLALAGCDAAKTAAPAGETTAAAPKPAALGTLDRSQAGTPAPTVAFERRGGAKATLADFKGKRVLVNLWATWCAPCIAEMPALDALATRSSQLTVLPISQDMEGWRVVEDFFKPGKFKTLTPVLDQPGSFAEAIKARGLPMSVLYDEQGREVWRVAGTVPEAVLKGL